MFSFPVYSQRYAACPHTPAAIVVIAAIAFLAPASLAQDARPSDNESAQNNALTD